MHNPVEIGVLRFPKTAYLNKTTSENSACQGQQRAKKYGLWDTDSNSRGKGFSMCRKALFVFWDVQRPMTAFWEGGMTPEDWLC
jgi:hypothetical protein